MSNHENVGNSYLIIKQACHRVDNKKGRPITQQEISDATHISMSSLGKFFAGYSKNPNIYSLVDIVTYINSQFYTPVLSLDRIFDISVPKAAVDNTELHELKTELAVKTEHISGLEAQLQAEREAYADLMAQVKRRAILSVTLGLSVLVSVFWNFVYILIDASNLEVGFIKKTGISVALYLFLTVFGVAFIVSIISWARTKKAYKEAVDAG